MCIRDRVTTANYLTGSNFSTKAAPLEPRAAPATDWGARAPRRGRFRRRGRGRGAAGGARRRRRGGLRARARGADGAARRGLRRRRALC